MTEYRKHAHTMLRIQYTSQCYTYMECVVTGFACGGQTSTISDLIGLSEFFDLI